MQDKKKVPSSDDPPPVGLPSGGNVWWPKVGQSAEGLLAKQMEASPPIRGWLNFEQSIFV